MKGKKTFVTFITFFQQNSLKKIQAGQNFPHKSRHFCPIRYPSGTPYWLLPWDKSTIYRWNE